MTKNLITSSLLSLCLTGAFYSSPSIANNISFEQMTTDITFLASDELKGRKNFSKEIDQAASYIEQRFTEIGLKPMSGLESFKQSFSIYQIKPSEVKVTIDGEEANHENIAFASTSKTFNWKMHEKNNQKNVIVHQVTAEMDMRATLGELNLKGGNHVVFVDRAHEPLFKRYHKYFSHGLIKNTLGGEHALILILTDDMQPKTLSVNATSEVKEQELTNIVGVLPGKVKPKEVVLYSAHYDHLGADEDSKAIYNGADDDASGTSAVINLAQHFAKQGNNARTLMFSAFTAEEIGGYGSQYFSKQLNADDVVAMINIEMIGKPSKFGAGRMWMTGMDRSNLGALLNSQLPKGVEEINADPYPEQKLFYRSDNATLARLGVPAHSFSSTQLDKDQHYHQTTDDINSLDLHSMHQVIEALSIATQGLVTGEITPTRVDVSKVNPKGKIY